MNKLKRLLATSNDPGSMGSKFRSRRFDFFERIFWEAFGKNKTIRILDIGGTEAFWKGRRLLQNPNVSISLLNLGAEPVSHPSLQSLSGNATDLSCFEDKSFDLVFSNSVIEHLYTFENQQKMAAEVRRVGQKYFVQTPNKYFFVEPHYALPFFQFLPSRFVYFILTETRLSRMQKWEPQHARAYLDEIRLLSLREMKSLFPDGRVYYEKFLGMNKSFTLYNL